MIKSIDDIKTIIFPKSSEQILYEKLMGDEDITKDDVKALELFNDHYIDILFNAGQHTVRGKMLEVMTRESVVVF